jgi:hypothetical protein
MIEATRQAAALWTHWNRDDEDGVDAVLDEVSSGHRGSLCDLRWMNFALALLNLGGNLVKAAAEGRETEHLAYVLRASSVDETTGEYRP